MSTIVLDRERVHIPAWVCDLTSFRRWAHSETFPKTGRICYLKGEVWVDMSKEQLFSHNQVKQEFNVVLGSLVKAAQLGRYCPDGMLLSNEQADLSCQPDGTFLSRHALEEERVRLVEGKDEGYVELEGTPDMVLEVVSTSSVEKDTETLRELYWEAGIPECWLVDARGEEPLFDILKHTPRGYVATRRQGGWLRSAVFGKSFRLSSQCDALGNPEFTLEVR